MADPGKDKGQLMSLYDMLNGTHEVIHKILIPKIQRDYAQGRPDKKSLRERFLASIFDVIDRPTDRKLILDFIFGQKEEKSRTIFYPVDGQQRLTTLFLLHIYVGKRSGADTEFLRKFSYETRDSSKQFCEKLHEIPADKFEGITDFIHSEWWFTGLWRTDPTITSMLNMLADIDGHYRSLHYGKDEFIIVWEQLKRNVEFWRLYLSDLDTTDEMYIKMNSRGKPLTEFEHFKAMLDEYAHSGGKLSAKVDTVWTNLLWRYRDERKDMDHDRYMDNGLDRCFRNLLVFYLNVEGCKRGLIDFQHPSEDIIALAQKVLGFNRDTVVDAEPRTLACMRLRKAVEARNIMRRFERIMDFFSVKDPHTHQYQHDPIDYFEKFIQPEYDRWTDAGLESMPACPRVFIGKRDDCDLLRAVCESGILKNEPTIYMEAFLQQASAPVPETDFRERLRILRNLVENTELHARSFTETLLVVDELIANGNMTLSGVNDEFNKTQKEQEIFKSVWLEANPSDAALLKAVENHRLIMGNINLVMARDADGNDTIDTVALAKVGRLFNSDCDYLRIERSLLTCGDYAPAVKTGGVRPYGGWKWTLWRDFTQSYNRTTPEVVQKFLSAYSSFTRSDLDAIIARGCDRVGRTRFRWEYYLCHYESIYNATNAKYRYLGGNYRYQKLNANGGGGREQYWNPYNLEVGVRLNAVGIKSVADCYGGVLELQDRNITVDIRESTIHIEYPGGSRITYLIPQDNGIDTVDRILFAAGVCRHL